MLWPGKCIDRHVQIWQAVICNIHHLMIFITCKSALEIQYCVLDWPEQAPPSPTVDVSKVH